MSTMRIEMQKRRICPFRIIRGFSDQSVPVGQHDMQGCIADCQLLLEDGRCAFAVMAGALEKSAGKVQ